MLWDFIREFLIGVLKTLGVLLIGAILLFLIWALLLVDAVIVDSRPVPHETPWPTNIPITKEHVLIQAPASALTGDLMTITLTVTNPREDELRLKLFSVSQRYLLGVDFGPSDPPYVREHDYIQQPTGAQFTSFIFNREVIPPLSTLTVEIQARPLSKGDYRGQLLVCFDPYNTCVTSDIQTVVSDP